MSMYHTNEEQGSCIFLSYPKDDTVLYCVLCWVYMICGSKVSTNGQVNGMCLCHITILKRLAQALASSRADRSMLCLALCIIWPCFVVLCFLTKSADLGPNITHSNVSSLSRASDVLLSCWIIPRFTLGPTLYTNWQNVQKCRRYFQGN